MPVLRLLELQTGKRRFGRLSRGRGRPTSGFVKSQPGAHDMLDVFFVVGGLAFFAISVGYTLICERL
jgi:hypothetical protein